MFPRIVILRFLTVDTNREGNNLEIDHFSYQIESKNNLNMSLWE